MALLGDLASLEQVWPCWKFATLRTQAMPNTQLYLLPADENGEFSASLGPYQPAHCHAFRHDHNRL